MKPGMSCKAFEDESYDYYKLTYDLGGIVPAGAIFVHDTDDKVMGSYSEGCLKLCWTKDGNCFRGKNTSICGGTVVFHAAFIKSGMFKLVSESKCTKFNKLKKLISSLENQLNDARNELEHLS